MRGKPPSAKTARSPTRITPAHAGKTAMGAAGVKNFSDHPRACGENAVSPIYSAITRGSPPRMRGKQTENIGFKLGQRITPAHAGKTAIDAFAGGGGADHPRACGENALFCTVAILQRGSPPRMRGKHGAIAGVGLGGRITPAHAGKTRRRASRFSFSADHPRACGENATAFGVLANRGGSPPRMRGKPLLEKSLRAADRITPAHAGKTMTRRSLMPMRSDHPRACGENMSIRGEVPDGYGSPPRMRGKRRRKETTMEQLRITPAHAGKT